MSEHVSGFVSIIGRPNVGKSTLLNRIIGEKVAIVSNKPQTTRNRIQAVKNYENAQVIFIDTPGIHKPLYRMNQVMLRYALNAVEGIDVLLVMMDVTQPAGKGDLFVLENLPSGKEKKFLLVNKVDIAKKPVIAEALAYYNSQYDFDEVIPISAETGENVDKLEALILDSMQEGPKYFPEDQVTDYSDGFLVSEIIREKILKETSDELPYSTAVMIEHWDESKDVERIHAAIIVDKDSHKGMIIGKGGQRLKTIGTLAREELERIYGTRFYLELWVKVRKKWRDDDRLLREMGLDDKFL